MKHFFLTVAVFIFFGFALQAQPWMEEIPAEKLNNESYTFYDVQTAFNKYWEGKEIERGKGWKQFKRWEYFMEPRVFPSGVFAPTNLLEISKQENLRANATESTADWTHMGPYEVPGDINNGSPQGVGRVNAVAFHPTDENIIYCGAPAGGFWRTFDGGLTWETTTDFLSSIGVSDILVNPTNPNIIYIATGDGDASDTYTIGVLKSTDGGSTWETTALSFDILDNKTIRRLAMCADNSNIIFAATSNGLYKTTDGFQTVASVLSGNIKDVKIKPENDNVVYAASYSYSGGSVYKSVNGGDNFSEAISGLEAASTRRITLAVTPDNPEVVYALACNSSNGLQGVYKSTNSAQTWTKVADASPNLLGWDPNGGDTGGQGWYDLSLEVSPTDENIILVGGVNIWKSENSGANWSIAAHWSGAGAPYVHADQHIFLYREDGVLFAGNDGGLYKSENDGDTWVDISDNLNILQIYRIGASATNPYVVTAGTQDNGTFKCDDDNWYAILGGDGMECIVDYTNENIMYGTLYYGNINKSTDGGHSFFNVSAANNGAWVTPFSLHPTDPNTIYGAYTVVYKSTNGGLSWSGISPSLAGGYSFNSMAIAPSNPNYIYVSAVANIWRTVDGGANWESISTGLPGNYITYITISDSDPEKIWVSLSGYAEGEKVYSSSDAGSTWENYSDGLPNIPTNCLLYQNGSNDLVYAGTDVGVYVRHDQMSEWIPYFNGLPNVIVNELEINYPTQLIRAATYGRGLWESPLYVDELVPPIASFVTNTNQACSDGSEIDFYSTSYGIIDNYTWNFGEGAVPQTATGEGPHSVGYSSVGEKTITLTVEGQGGTNTITEENYINVVDELILEVTPENPSVCQGATVNLVAIGAVDYSWSPATYLNTTTGANVVSTPMETTTYTVIGTNGSCSGEITVTINVTVVENDNAETPTVLLPGLNGPFSNQCASVEPNEPMPPLTGCNGQMSWCGEGGLQNSIWFSFETNEWGAAEIITAGFDNQIALYDADSWEDLFNGNYTLLAANDDYISADYAATIQTVDGLTPNKTYWLQMDGSAGGSVGICTITLNLPSSINEIAENVDVKVYPNPNQGAFALEFNKNISDFAIVEVYDIAGNMMQKQQFKNVVEGTPNYIYLGGESKGVFYLKITTSEETIYRKVVVQ